MEALQLPYAQPHSCCKHLKGSSLHASPTRHWPGVLQTRQALRARRPYLHQTARPASIQISCKAAVPLSFRAGTAADAPVMRELVWSERMNPLGITPERFTVAVDESGKMLGFGQLEQKDGYKELRTMVVDPSCRRQGVGRALLEKLLEQAAGADVLLTTITSRIGFYTGAGFRRLDLKEVPGSLLFEVVAGTLVARLAAGEELVVLKKSC